MKHAYVDRIQVIWLTSFTKYPLLVITRAPDFLNACRNNSTSMGLCQLNAVDTRLIHEVSSDGLLRKNKNILQTMYIAIWCTHRTLLFDIVFTIVEALVISLHQFLYPFFVEWCCLWCKTCGKGFFNLVIIVEPPASKKEFKMKEQMKITWR